MDSLPSLHSRIARAFNDEELRTFCFDRFPMVHDDFTIGMTKGQMIRLLLEHCVRHQAGEALLDALERERPDLVGGDRDALFVWLDAARFEEAHSGDKLTSALHQLRAPVGDFVGRTVEIAELTDTMRRAIRDGAVAAISGVRGMGGICTVYRARHPRHYRPRVQDSHQSVKRFRQLQR